MRPNQKSEDASGRFAAVLERIRAGSDRLLLDDVGAWDEDERVRKLGLPVACQHACTRLEMVYCSDFLRQMSRQMRRKEGDDLAFELRLLVDRWVRHGLDRSLLEELVCHCYTELCQGTGPENPEFRNQRPECRMGDGKRTRADERGWKARSKRSSSNDEVRTVGQGPLRSMTIETRNPNEESRRRETTDEHGCTRIRIHHQGTKMPGSDNPEVRMQKPEFRIEGKEPTSRE